ncbi:hypothetical protein GCM10022419_100520 [Nonomuraea rosea]|uniref:HAD family hydrolase n=1 Tax=Nonomuraea rosea TaxID=638574 RepID=A0ABP6Z9E1_9ACTN
MARARSHTLAEALPREPAAQEAEDFAGQYVREWNTGVHYLPGIEPSSALFVGDTFVPDYEGPRRAGMTALLIDPLERARCPRRTG